MKFFVFYFRNSINQAFSSFFLSFFLLISFFTLHIHIHYYYYSTYSISILFSNQYV